MCDNGGKEEDTFTRSDTLSCRAPHIFFWLLLFVWNHKVRGNGTLGGDIQKRNIPRDSLLCILTFLQVKQTDGDKLEKKNNNKK